MTQNHQESDKKEMEMHLKTINGSGDIFLEDYTEEECRDIFLERNSYVFRIEHSFGNDYGGSHVSEECVISYEEIIPEYILVKDGRFYGACICREYDYTNGGHKTYLEEVILPKDEKRGSYARMGVYFSNDDHIRWDYADYYLTDRVEMERAEGEK